MLTRGPFRVLLTLALAAWFPCCCCTLHGMESVCVACQEQEHGDDDAAADDHGAASHHHDDSSPARPKGPCHDRGPCTCNDQKQSTVGVQKSTIQWPIPVLAYFLPDCQSGWRPHGVGEATSHPNRAPLKPCTSLLLQHCALIV